MALCIDVGPDDVLQIGDNFVTVERKSGSRARLKIVGKIPVKLMRRARQREVTLVDPAVQPATHDV